MLKIVLIAACFSVSYGMIRPKAHCEAPEVPCGHYDCYTESTHVCLQLRDGHRPCPIGNTLCGSSCFNPASTQVCLESTSGLQSHRICEAGQKLCGFGDHCYTPETHACLKSKSSAASFVCPHGEEECGFWGCYKAGEHTCDEHEGLTAIA